MRACCVESSIARLEDYVRAELTHTNTKRRKGHWINVDIVHTLCVIRWIASETQKKPLIGRVPYQFYLRRIDVNRKIENIASGCARVILIDVAFGNRLKSVN